LATPAIPQNIEVSQANATVLITWDAQAGATSYSIQRSTDNVNFSVLDTSVINKYVDDSVAIGTQYWYKVASVNGSGTSSYSSTGTAVPAPTGELSLYELRLRAQQRADMVNNQFVTTTEWNYFINQSLLELYDLLIDVYEDYFKAPNARFQVDGSTYIYPLPNGTLEFTDVNGDTFVAKPFYKMLGIDLALNTATNAFVTVYKYNFIDRNRYVYPNSNGTIYGVFNLQYRVVGNNIEFIPPPSAGQTIQLLYAPRLDALLQDTDISTIGYGGWLQYAIVRAAKYALDKEESDTSKLDTEILFLKERIQSAAQNRDAGMPNTISDVQTPWGDRTPYNGYGSGGW
jgi:hypothetical protein